MREIAWKYTRKAAVAVAGGIVVLIGIIAIPYPGPGWLIVFAGLAILSLEFERPKRLLAFGRRKYDEINAWITRQAPFIRVLTFMGAGIVMIATLWIFNIFGYINDFAGLGFDRVRSPLPWYY